jgi:hypothetical protein
MGLNPPSVKVYIERRNTEIKIKHNGQSSATSERKPGLLKRPLRIPT